MLKFFFDILKGVVIGIANIIPGVSGGTMMVSMGIYDEIIGSINNLFKNFKKSFMTVLPYGIGMLLGIVGFAFAIEWMFAKLPIPTALLFVGLIFGGIPLIFKNVKGKINPLNIVLFVLFFALVIGLEIMGQHTGAEKNLDFSIVNMAIAFLLSIVASATMIIPGVSGSMVMMILGYYHSVMSTIKGCVSSLAHGDFSAFLSAFGIIIPLALGIVIGIFGVAKLIEYLLKKHKAATYSAILGLICASPYPIYMGISDRSLSPLVIILGIVFFAAGFTGAMKLSEK